MSDEINQSDAKNQKRMLSRRGVVLGLGMLAASGATFARAPVRKFPAINERNFENLFPHKAGEWTSYDSNALILPPQDDLSRKLYERLLTRVYVDASGAAVMCMAAYSSVQIDDVQVHRPEVCYRVAGFQIKDSRPVEERFGASPLIDARIVETQSRQRSENIIYWTRVGDDFPVDWTAQRLAMLKANIRGYYPDGLLLRLSSIKSDLPEALSDIRRFADALYAAATPQGKKIIFGVA